jgi:hypothetical protein
VSGEERGRVAALRRLRRDSSPFLVGMPAEIARPAIWVVPRLVGLVEFTGIAPDGRLRLPRWRGPVPPADVDDTRWAVPAGLPPSRVVPPSPPPSVEPEPEPEPEPPAPAAAVQTRRLEQHFVYNALNTIAALIRTDPGRARELLFGFADLSRAADRSGNATTTLGDELDAVRGYLQLEQARFGPRLRVEVDVDAGLRGRVVTPLQVLSAVRDAVQRDIEPRPQGGVLTISAGPVPGGHALTVAGGAGEPTVIELGRAAAMPG